MDCNAASAAEWRCWLLRMLEVTDGRPYIDEVTALCDGGKEAVGGFEWLCRHVRLLRPLGCAEKADPTAVIYEVGLSQQRCEVLQPQMTVERLQEVMATIGSFDLAIPETRVCEPGPASSQEEPRALPGQSVAQMDVEALVFKVIALSEALCGTGASSGVGMLARRLLALAEHRRGEEVWDACKMEVLTQASPDLGHHVACLSSMEAGVVRRRFGISPLWLPFMCGLWEQVSAHGQASAMQRSYPQLLQAAQKCATLTANPRDWVAHL
jgi:hypothetical protein